MRIDYDLTPPDLAAHTNALFETSAHKLRELERSWNPSRGAPVFTVGGLYTSRGWTEWTQGFQFGSGVLQFDATGEIEFLEAAREHTVNWMAPHITHTGVHDHGFNNVSTYGSLLRLMDEGRTPENLWERRFYELALKCSGAVQAGRWSMIAGGGGYIPSFNGPHSLFVDTIRTLRALAISHRLGHVLLSENDLRISLLDRVIEHALATARFSVYYGEGRDAYDVRGRVAHESVFNANDGKYRCPNSQQGYSPFSTWTRGLAWAMCGFAELLEFLDTVADEELSSFGGRDAVSAIFQRAAEATCDFYIDSATAADGVPYWDTGAPDLEKLGDWRNRPAEPRNAFEPVDSSAAAIAAQGLLRLGHRMQDRKYWGAGLTICRTLFAEPYLSADPKHQGLILHAIYHRPNGWDAAPLTGLAPHGEACMWGDYHARELALYLLRVIDNKPYLTFWSEPHDRRRPCGD
ncbi:MAG: glycoside hydrolase family 88 protein [Acidobacteriota bacterium]|nr:glycoside hydrolase family 88 protein [Acidobacteriota bacterium]